MIDNLTTETLQKVRAALAASWQKPADDILAKAWLQSGSATSGLTAYDLEAPAKLLYPVLTPLRNVIPRVTGGVGIQANWRAITGVNTTLIEPGVDQGNRGGVISSTTADYLAAFRGIGLEDFVTFEAQYAGATFDDVRARAVQGLLRSLMIAEEQLLLGGDTSFPLGQTGTPTATDQTTGGTFAFNTTYSVIAVGLTLNGFQTGVVGANGVRAQVSRINADGSTTVYGGGAAKQSAAGSVTTANDSNNTHALKVSVTAQTGALGYAWFAGLAGQEKICAITSLNSAILTTPAAAGNQTAASLGTIDWSQNGTVFDGLLYQAFKAGSGAYVKSLPTGVVGTGTALTSDGAGGVVEFNSLLKDRWDNYRLSPDKIWVSSQEQQSLNKLVLANANTGAQRFNFTVEQGQITGGVMVRAYLNPFTMNGAKAIPIEIHPNLPPGTVLFDTDTIPYPLSNVGNVKRVLCRQDYYQLEWPLKTRKYEYGVYADEVLQHYFPPALGVITNIAPS